MPQFEIFSFSSQITWTFLCFSLVYSIFCYSLCPMLAAILKTRKLQVYASSKFTYRLLDNNCDSVKSSLWSKNINDYIICDLSSWSALSKFTPYVWQLDFLPFLRAIACIEFSWFWISYNNTYIHKSLIHNYFTYISQNFF